VTDDKGAADFLVAMLRESADWADVKLKVTAGVKA
jgi:hypothetical protein